MLVGCADRFLESMLTAALQEPGRWMPVIWMLNVAIKNHIHLSRCITMVSVVKSLFIVRCGSVKRGMQYACTIPIGDTCVPPIWNQFEVSIKLSVV